MTLTLNDNGISKRVKMGYALRIYREALDASIKAANEQFAKLESAGPRYAVNDGRTGLCVGTLLDNCGGAYLWLRNQPFIRDAKKVNAEMGEDTIPLRKGYPTGFDLSVRCTTKQEMSVHTAGAEAFSAVLARYGIEAQVREYID